MDSHHEVGSSNKRMLHKRQRVVATTVETASTNPRGSGGRFATQTDTATTAASQHERPSFMTASTRATAVTTTTTTPAAATTSSTTADPTTSSTTTPANTRNRGTTSSSSSSASPSSPTSATIGTHSSGFNQATATPINASPKSDSSSSSSHGGAVAGAVIAVIAVLAIGVGFFVWRKRRNNRLAREGTGLIAGSGFSGGAGGAGGYKKQDETQDAWDGSGTGGNGSFGRDDSSLFGGREKTFSQESFGATQAGGGGAGYGATSTWNQPPQQQQYYNGGGDPQAPAWNNGSNVYPPSNQPLPASTANLLSHQPPSHGLPESLAAGAGAGAAGFGAARLLAAQSVTSSPRGSLANGNDYGHHQSIEQRELQQELDNRRQSFLNKTQPNLPPPIAAVAPGVGSGAGESSPFGESEGQGEVRVVKGTFDPSLDDELVLYPGDKVQVLMKYDDGWALGLNLSSGNPPSKGVFPFDCLGEEAAAPLPHEIRTPGSSAPVAAQRSLSPVNPANIPLPPPTPTLLSPIHEDEQPPSHSSVTNSGPPQLAPFERSDSPLSPDFPPSALAVPSSTNSSPTKSATKLKRHSSLIASRDADLFVALGEVLDKEKR